SHRLDSHFSMLADTRRPRARSAKPTSPPAPPIVRAVPGPGRAPVYRRRRKGRAAGKVPRSRERTLEAFRPRSVRGEGFQFLVAHLLKQHLVHVLVLVAVDAVAARGETKRLRGDGHRLDAKQVAPEPVRRVDASLELLQAV